MCLPADRSLVPHITELTCSCSLHCSVRTVLLNSSLLLKSLVPKPFFFSCPESTYRHLSTYLSPCSTQVQLERLTGVVTKVLLVPTSAEKNVSDCSGACMAYNVLTEADRVMTEVSWRSITCLSNVVILLLKVDIKSFAFMRWSCSKLLGLPALR